MKNLFKELVVFLGFAFCFVLISSCSKDGTFSIIGSWGMVSGTISNGSGNTTRFEPLGSGSYYEYLEFKANGTLIRTSLPDKDQRYGTYTYNDATREMSYKYDGDKYYYPATVLVISPKEMNLTTDLGTVGRRTQYFVKVKK